MPRASAIDRAADIVADLTLEEKASLTSGASFWTTKPVERVGLPAIMLTDGPHGVRKQRASADHLGIGDSVPATCFPPAVALGSSFDPELLERVGVALGEESQAEGVGVLLGPGINIKRSPLCGRNFEYLSEDPIVSGVLGSALVRGLQSQGVGASLKHFAANNQEADRMRVSADIDERPLREIYLRGFQRVVEDEQPWTVMCSYNRLNGVYTSEDPWLLTKVLRDEWGFDGLVVSDWGAVNERITGLAAGLDLEMPSSEGRTDAQLVAAVRSGVLDERLLDTAARRNVELVQKAVRGARADAAYDVDAHHALAREVAGASIVLLKNDDAVLPLAAGASVAVIGELARTPRYQGAGSSQINPTRLDNALDEIRALAGAEVPFAAGYGDDGAISDELAAEAVAAASAAETVLLFLGVPAALESEGFDRDDIELPAAQLALADAVIAANPRTVVVLSNGGVVRLSDLADAGARDRRGLAARPGRRRRGRRRALRRREPLGPSRRDDPGAPRRQPRVPRLPGRALARAVRRGPVRGLPLVRRARARGRIPVRAWTLVHDVRVLGCLGVGRRRRPHGARHRDEHGRARGRRGRAGLHVAARLGRGSGPARAQGLREGGARRRGVPRGRGARAPRATSRYWDTRVDAWVVEGGAYAVEVGASSRDIRATASVEVDGDGVRVPLTMNSSIGELMAHPVASQIIMQAMAADGSVTAGLMADPGMFKMMESFPIGRLASFPGMPVGREQVEQLLAAANARRSRRRPSVTRRAGS